MLEEDLAGEVTPATEDALDAVTKAQELVNPLEGLAERCKDDAGAPFEEEPLHALLHLRRENRAEFERLRKAIKPYVLITELDKCLKDIDDTPKVREPTPAEILAELTKENARLFHTKDGKAYADVDANTHRETWPVSSKGFRRWLSQQYHEATNGAASGEAIRSALDLIEARAVNEGPELEVAVRVASHEGRSYLDLCDEDWHAVEIDGDGWRIVSQPPVRFVRYNGMRELPEPKHGGSINTLRRFVNVKSEHDWVLAVSWLLGALHPSGPYPVLAVAGEQGSAKSTFSGLLRSMIDPNAAPLRSLPRDQQDLFISANNARILAFDNISNLPYWLSDTLCKLATGGGFSTRELYTNGEEAIFEARRPIILNGIEDFVSRPDLADRSLFLTLESIPEDKRRPESPLLDDFESEKAQILGALLDGVSEGIRRIDAVELSELPRMADFARWASACETAFWQSGTFLKAYESNREESVSQVLDLDPIGSGVCQLMDGKAQWEGTASDLLKELKDGYVDEDTVRAKGFPNTPIKLANRLIRITPALRKHGIDVVRKRLGNERTRTICLSKKRAAETLPWEGAAYLAKKLGDEE